MAYMTEPLDGRTLHFASQCTHLMEGVSSFWDAEVEAECYSTAVIAIGNPLIEKDVPATRLLTRNDSLCQRLKICTFAMDSGFAWIKQILHQHEKTIVIDTVLENLPEGWIFTALKQNVLAQNSLAIDSSHGLSWLDELKFELLNDDQLSRIFFLGISADISRANWNALQKNFVNILRSTKCGEANRYA